MYLGLKKLQENCQKGKKLTRKLPERKCFEGLKKKYTKNKLVKLGDVIAISNLKLSITDPLTD